MAKPTLVMSGVSSKTVRKTAKALSRAFDMKIKAGDVVDYGGKGILLRVVMPTYADLHGESIQPSWLHAMLSMSANFTGMGHLPQGIYHLQIDHAGNKEPTIHYHSMHFR